MDLAAPIHMFWFWSSLKLFVNFEPCFLTSFAYDFSGKTSDALNKVI